MDAQIHVFLMGTGANAVSLPQGLSQSLQMNQTHKQCSILQVYTEPFGRTVQRSLHGGIWPKYKTGKGKTLWFHLVSDCVDTLKPCAGCESKHLTPTIGGEQEEIGTVSIRQQQWLSSAQCGIRQAESLEHC